MAFFACLLFTAHTIVSEGDVFSIYVCPQWGGGAGPVPSLVAGLVLRSGGWWWWWGPLVPGGASPSSRSSTLPPLKKFGHNFWTQIWTKNLVTNFAKFWRWGAWAVCLLQSRRRTVFFPLIFAFITKLILGNLWKQNLNSDDCCAQK